MDTSSQRPAKLTIDRQKLRSYLLNLNHPRGASKAKFFLGWGFRTDDLDTFEAALLSHYDPTRISNAHTTKYDFRFEVLGPLNTPHGMAPRVCTVWGIDKGSVDGRLLTAYPY